MPNITAIRVEIWGHPVGVLTADPATRALAFAYYPTWLEQGIDLAPLTMPVRAAQRGRVWTFPEIHESFHGLPGWIADALPDDFGNALIDAWMASNGVQKRAITVLDRLAYMGRRSMGALEFQPEQGPKNSDEDTAPIAMKALVEEARTIIRGTFDQAKAAASLSHLIRVGTSAGGARAKAVIAWDPASNEIRSGQFDAPVGFEHWLVKLDGVGAHAELGSSSGYGRIEYAYHLMATAAGIGMSPCRLLEEGGRAHFMTKRFDRDGSAKHHLSSLCGMAHLSYRQKSTHAYEQLFMAVGDLGLDEAAKMEAFRRTVFNVAARNQDDHTKNFAFLLGHGRSWQLAPAYDVTFAYNPAGEWTSQHLMSVNRKFADIGRADLLALARRFAIADADRIIGEVQRAVGMWPEFAAKAGVEKGTGEAIRACHVPVGTTSSGR